MKDKAREKVKPGVKDKEAEKVKPAAKDKEAEKVKLAVSNKAEEKEKPPEMDIAGKREESQEDNSNLDEALEEGVLERGTSVSYTSLKSVGVNVKIGLDYCCGDEDFYMEMLQMFQSQSADKKAEIIALYEAADWANYAVKVHALKSTSLTIGAERLSAYAKLLEHAGKKEDVKYIRKNHLEFLRMYDEVCEGIAKL